LVYLNIASNRQLAAKRQAKGKLIFDDMYNMMAEMALNRFAFQLPIFSLVII